LIVALKAPLRLGVTVATTGPFATPAQEEAARICTGLAGFDSGGVTVPAKAIVLPEAVIALV
jgi:hypothetical protein